MLNSILKKQEESVAVIETKKSRNSVSFNSTTVRHLIIDFSCVNFIDSQGANTILHVKTKKGRVQMSRVSLRKLRAFFV
jgi:hypothetical protein